MIAQLYHPPHAQSPEVSALDFIVFGIVIGIIFLSIGYGIGWYRALKHYAIVARSKFPIATRTAPVVELRSEHLVTDREIRDSMLPQPIFERAIAEVRSGILNQAEHYIEIQKTGDNYIYRGVIFRASLKIINERGKS